MTERQSLIEARPTRIVFRRYAGLQTYGDEDLAEGESVEIDGVWLHIVTYEGPTAARKFLRSYPTHSVDAVLHGE